MKKLFIIIISCVVLSGCIENLDTSSRSDTGEDDTLYSSNIDIETGSANEHGVTDQTDTGESNVQTNGVLSLNLPSKIGFSADNTPTINKIRKRVYSDADTDYAKADTLTIMDGDSAMSLELANMFLCIVEHSDAVTHINTNAYSAPNNFDAPCFTHSDSNETTRNVVIESTRLDNNSPQVIDIAFTYNYTDPDDNTSHESNYYVNFSITKGVSDQDKLGEFAVMFTSEQVNSEMTDKGWLNVFKENDKPTIELAITFSSSKDSGFYSNKLQFADTTLSNGVNKEYVKFSYDGGSGLIEQEFMNTTILSPSVYLTNENFFTNGELDTSNEICKSRTQFTDYVWSYGLYDINSGSEILSSVENMYYLHDVANDLNNDSTYAGQEYFINWVWDYGYPHLDIPIHIHLKAGTTIGMDNEYVVKPLFIVQEPIVLDASDCTNLDQTIADALVLPVPQTVSDLTILLADAPILSP